MLVHSLAEKRDVRRKRNVAGKFLPCELESVAAQPYILAAAGNRVAAFCRIVFHRTRVQNGANITVTIKCAGWRGSRRASLSRPCAISGGEG
ncbi:MAG: hypothetical protein AUI12_08730 [Acidobacteria bacterium 13_2_20CM_2_57_6]|nr:MAG: hypothetical protein AUI12_08730 [Acidobacteria bacterium 13_2_20CM_2_57_6]